MILTSPYLCAAIANLSHDLSGTPPKIVVEARKWKQQLNVQNSYYLCIEAVYMHVSISDEAPMIMYRPNLCEMQ